ncbi:glycosyltransferase family 2 protein [Candidatus Beckwithbacteria bacterium]|nr:glycosyltransferase family 2 protein [Candidatus Beckwithbacteria bacterium]
MLLSIIIVSYNTKKLLEDCLQSLFGFNQSRDFEVIVVDNASNDESIEMLKKKFKQVKIIENKQNLGFGKANNLGVCQAAGRYVLLLNSDTRFKDGVIDKIINERLHHQSLKNKVLGIKLINENGTIQPSVGFFPNFTRILMQMFFLDDLPLVKNFYRPYQQNNLAFYQTKQKPDWVTGAFFLISKDNFNKVQGFDEHIFMYGEEVDLCFRLQKVKVEVEFNPAWEIYHLKGKSSQDGFEAAVLGEYKGLVTFYEKHYSGKMNYLKFILKIGALIRILLFSFLNKEKAKVYQKAWKII